MHIPKISIDKLSLRPSIWLIGSTAVFLVNYFAGPYSYKIENIDGIFYFVLCWLSFFVGMFISESRENFNQNLSNISYELTKKQERRLCLCMFVLLLCFLISTYYLLYIVNLNYSEGLDDFRQEASITANANAMGFKLSWGVRLAYFLTYGSSASYLIVSQLDKTHYKFTQFLSLVCLLLPAGITLIRGGRVGAVIVVFIVIIAGIIRHKRGKPFISSQRLVTMTLYVAVGIILFTIFTLFIVRGGYESSLEMSRYLGYERLISGSDIRLKEFYVNLNDVLRGQLSPLYRMSMYMSHSLPVFSDLFHDAHYDVIYYGGFHLRIIGYILQFMGILPNYSQRQIVGSHPYTGQYSTAVPGFLLDFGFYATIPVLLILGLLLGHFYNRARNGNYCILCLLPIMYIIILVFPISYIRWGAMDFMVFTYILLFFGVGLMPRTIRCTHGTDTSSVPLPVLRVWHRVNPALPNARRSRTGRSGPWRF